MPSECVNNKGAWGGSNSSLHGQEVEEEVARVSESLQVHNSQWPKDLLPLGSTSQIVTGGTELLTCVPWGTSSIQIIASAIRKNKTRKWYIPDDKTKNASCHVKSNFESPGNCHGGCDDSMVLLQAAEKTLLPERCVGARGKRCQSGNATAQMDWMAQGWWCDPESRNYSHLD